MTAIDKLLEIEAIGKTIIQILDKLNIKKYGLYFDSYNLEDYEDFSDMPCVIYVVIPNIKENAINKFSNLLNKVNLSYDICVEKNLYKIFNVDTIKIGGTL